MQHAQEHDVVGSSIPRSSFYNSPFGRMFGRLAPWVPPGADDRDREDQLLAFAEQHMVEAPSDGFLENDKIPAAYTYFGQFVDHDITFDPTSSTVRLNDPNKLRNFRTPRFDLDSVYGAGPDASPFLYNPDDYGMFLIGTGESPLEPDLPRNSIGTALIGDPRNDENIIVSQIQLTFLKLHNAVLGSLRGAGATDAPDHVKQAQFHEAQRIVRWFYQYVVWNDFVKRLVHDTLWSAALELKTEQAATSRSTNTWVARKRFYKWKQSPYIPVEFSTAAYRFGHSMVRPGYQVNNNVGFQSELPIFAVAGSGVTDLAGGSKLPKGFSLQWDWYVDAPSNANVSFFPQPTRKIDVKLSSAMSNIPIGKNPDGTVKTAPLSFLNLRRGWRMELPSGPDVADYLGIPDDSSNRPSVAPGTAEESLWFYILAETKMSGAMSGKMLGPVGGTIVADVFAGLLDGDPLSYVNIDPLWKPGDEQVLQDLGVGATTGMNGGEWEFADILSAASMPFEGHEVPAVATDPIVFPAPAFV